MRSLAKELDGLARKIGDGDTPGGPLTDDLTRLREEMRASRAERQAFVRSLKASVAAMRADFRDAHARMAWASLEKRRRFVADLANAHGVWFGVRTSPTP